MKVIPWRLRTYSAYLEAIPPSESCKRTMPWCQGTHLVLTIKNRKLCRWSSVWSTYISQIHSLLFCILQWFWRSFIVNRIPPLKLIASEISHSIMSITVFNFISLRFQNFKKCYEIYARNETFELHPFWEDGWSSIQDVKQWLQLTDINPTHSHQLLNM
jgi:hypothetical protein